VALNVSLKTLPRDDIVIFRSRYGLSGTRAVILGTSTVYAALTIQSGKDLVLKGWPPVIMPAPSAAGTSRVRRDRKCRQPPR